MTRRGSRVECSELASSEEPMASPMESTDSGKIDGGVLLETEGLQNRRTPQTSGSHSTTLIFVQFRCKNLRLLEHVGTGCALFVLFVMCHTITTFGHGKGLKEDNVNVFTNVKDPFLAPSKIRCGR